MAKLTMGATEWALLIALSVLWGGSFFFAEVALGDLAPMTIVAGRVGLAALALTVWIHLSGEKMPRDRRLWGAFFVMGGLNNAIPFGLIVWGQVHIDSGLASVLNGTTPIFTVILAHFLTRDERMTPGKMAGVLFGLAGVAVLIGPEALHGLGLQGLGQIAILGAAVSYACAGIYGRRLKAVPTSAAAAGMLIASTVMTVPLALIFERPFDANPGLATYGAMVGIAVLSTAMAYLIYFRLLATAGATNLLLVTLLIPVSALVLGMAILGERLEWNAFAGMGLIFVGLASVDGRTFAAMRRRRSVKAAITD